MPIEKVAVKKRPQGRVNFEVTLAVCPPCNEQEKRHGVCVCVCTFRHDISRRDGEGGSLRQVGGCCYNA